MTSYPSDSQQTCDWEPNEGNDECCTKLIGTLSKDDDDSSENIGKK